MPVLTVKGREKVATSTSSVRTPAESATVTHTGIHAGKRILEAVMQLSYASISHIHYRLVRRELNSSHRVSQQNREEVNSKASTGLARLLGEVAW